MPTIFERIAAGEFPCHKVWESETHLAFLDINPRVPGHTLVVPKVAEADYLFDLPADRLAALMHAAQTAAARLRSVLGCQRVCVAVYGFEVPHVHVHLLPANDMHDVPMPPIDEAAKAGLKAMAARLAAS